MLIDALASEELPYMVVGSSSSNFYGISRSTQDIDLVVDWGSKSVHCLRPHLNKQFHIDPQMSFETVTGTKRNTISLDSSSFEIELFYLSDDPHDQQRFQRRQAVDISGKSVFLPTPEDVIVTKLRWFRKKDQLDLRNIIAVMGERLE
ncbi:MAG TPA: DUF6036 family nucleotidyltransferase [Planctomycetaceae bacterium]|nr:DUF6036 family nucleotidyltransferase [Planctomycetaceae bacterium]